MVDLLLRDERLDLDLAQIDDVGADVARDQELAELGRVALEHAAEGRLDLEPRDVPAHAVEPRLRRAQPRALALGGRLGGVAALFELGRRRRPRPRPRPAPPRPRPARRRVRPARGGRAPGPSRRPRPGAAARRSRDPWSRRRPRHRGAPASGRAGSPPRSSRCARLCSTITGTGASSRPRPVSRGGSGARCGARTGALGRGLLGRGVPQLEPVEERRGDEQRRDQRYRTHE